MNERGFPNPAAATRDAPWVNSQGMAFLPVPGLHGRLVARLETRMDDWRAFLTSVTGPDAAEWEAAFGQSHEVRAAMHQLLPGGWTQQASERRREPVANFAEQPGSAAWGMNWQMARRFCSWLTWKEQRDGRLGPGEFYRLPTDMEWSTAAGLPPEPGATPKARHEALPPEHDRYPWGPAWPPPAEFANYAGQEARDANWPVLWHSLRLAKDAFPRVATAGSFPPNPHGLHDLWGNVWEWCEDRMDLVSSDYVLRGGSWVDGGYDVQLRRDFRYGRGAGYRDSTTGFRCVLVFALP
jgi:formylglycine-generating enzyme required for sulfatase activity